MRGKTEKQESLTTTITVSIRTSLFTKNLPQYSNALTVSIPYPTSFTPDLIKHARTCLEVIYKEGYHYHKAGVSFSHLVPDETIQPDLFADFSLESHYRQMRLMAMMDANQRNLWTRHAFSGSPGENPWVENAASLLVRPFYHGVERDTHGRRVSA